MSIYICMLLVTMPWCTQCLLVKCSKRHEKFVVKQIVLDLITENERKAALQECELLKGLRHPNIVTYIDSFLEIVKVPSLYIVMQHCAGGDLATHIKCQQRAGQLYEELQILDWFSQMALAVSYIHEKRVLHRDLKTNNVFLTVSCSC
jgi:NIMA (never in mitosis gene a)-related kinase 1/4/5